MLNHPKRSEVAMKKWWIAAILALLMVLLAVGVGPVGAKEKDSVGAKDKDSKEESSYQSSIKVPSPAPKDLMSLAKITTEQAQKAALDANPGAKVIKTKLENENSNLVWSVTLSGGVEVQVDAGNGKVLNTEKHALPKSKGVKGQRGATKSH